MSFFKIENLSVIYNTSDKKITAVNDCSFEINKGDCLGIVGESGSGKSTLASAIMQLHSKNNTAVCGNIILDNKSLLKMTSKEFDAIRWIDISMVFQKAMNSFSPVHKIGKQLKNVYKVHFPKENSKKIKSDIIETLNICNLDSNVYDMYPFELSGGMLQRVSIAMALIHRPKLVILDEATTALDVITQQQIISELNAIRKKYDITTIVISHDLSVISKLCNKVAVMYCGRILEFGNKSDIINAPKHPYTKALISSYPKFTDEKGSLSGIPGCLADMGKEIVGCVFKERCAYCTDICKNTNPQYEQIDDTHHICCHLWRKTI